MSRSPLVRPLGTLLGLAALAQLSCSDNGPRYVPVAPAAAILEPADVDGIPEFALGDPVRCVASVSDDQTPPEDLAITWSIAFVDEDGASAQRDLGVSEADSGGRTEISAGDLSATLYTLHLAVTDESDLTTHDYVDFRVVEPDEPPTVSILAPPSGESFDFGAEVPFIGSATDDRGPEALTASWNSDIDGQLDATPPAEDGLMEFVAADLSSGEHLVTVTVTDASGLQATDSVIVTVVPENLPPTMPIVVINPSGPVDDDDLACSAAGSVDPEGGPVTYSYAWLLDGAPYSWTDSTLTHLLTVNGQTWTCVAVGFDDHGLASQEGQAQVTIGNSEPSYSSVTLTPLDATETSTLTCTPYGWFDPDGDPEGRTIEWTVSGTGIAAADPTLDGASFDHFDTVSCRVTPFDGHGYGTPLTSNVVTIANTAPGAPVVAITPPSPPPGEGLACAATTPGADPDLDPQTYTFEWYRDGVLQAAYASDSVPGTATAIGEEWSCRVFPSDGYATGPWGGDAVTIVPRAGDLVIAEVMLDPGAVSDAAGEYIEVWNAASYPIDLSGFTLQDDGGEVHVVSPASGSLPLAPGEAAVLGRDPDFAVNGGVIVDYRYEGFSLDDASDEIVLAFDGAVVDRVAYGGGFTLRRGAALSLDPGTFDAASNDGASAWCPATTPIQAGGDFGTPGLPNDACACADSDGDGDGFGDDAACAAAFIDCDDADPAAFPGAPETCDDGVDDDCSGADLPCDCEVTDLDGDGYGTGPACPVLDCDDGDGSVHPGAAEVCNGVDDDCDAVADEGHDGDGDGYTTCAGDCSDGNPNAHPGLVETCNGFDDDCDGSYDVEDSVGCGTWYHDGDADGYGAGPSHCLCFPTAYYDSAYGTDCNDGNDSIRPGAAELCDLVDQDCDGTVDEGFDTDSDGVTTCGGDCDDGRADVRPGAAEACNARDDDCDGVVDEGFDADGDGWTTCEGDCDDARALTFPGASEACNGTDDDCDLMLDEAGAIGCVNYYGDGDGDGYGAGAGACLCGPDGSYEVTNASDCDDASAAVRPGAIEVCNGVDDDCDLGIDEGFDADGDTYTTCEGDCDDGDGDVRPGAAEVCNGVDDDCDLGIDEGYDADGDGYTSCGGDCNDGNGAVKPGATETCNGQDDDCDGTFDVEGSAGCLGYYHDGDGDGYGAGASHCLCSPDVTYDSLYGTDCNDGNDEIHPGRAEACDGIDQDCDGFTDEGFDIDGDGWTTCEGDCNDFMAAVKPGATESCNGYDDDCDGATDEQNATGCTNRYADNDNDGYGAGAAACLCAADAVYKVTNNSDCYDLNASAKPGQTSYFASHRGDGSYDYNCDGSSSKRWTNIYQSHCEWDACYFESQGWEDVAPSCGSADTWVESCAGALWVCWVSDSYTRTQECR